jgi:hypothetical protein
MRDLKKELTTDLIPYIKKRGTLAELDVTLKFYANFYRPAQPLCTQIRD